MTPAASPADPYVTVSMLNEALDRFADKLMIRVNQVVQREVGELAAILSDFMVQVDERFNRIEARLDRVESRLDEHDGHFKTIEAQLKDHNWHFHRIEAHLDDQDAELGRLNKKYNHNMNALDTFMKRFDHNDIENAARDAQLERLEELIITHNH